jgi:Protein of unknown function (DUF3467)
MNRFRKLRTWILAAVLGVLCVPEIFVEVSYSEQHRELIGMGPSARFPLGTDDLGRDRFARLLYAARTSLLLASAAALGNYGIRQQRDLLGARIRSVRVFGQAEKILHRGLERTRQLQRDGCIGHIACGLHRVDGLPADSDLLFGKWEVLREYKASSCNDTCHIQSDSALAIQFTRFLLLECHRRAIHKFEPPYCFHADGSRPLACLSGTDRHSMEDDAEPGTPVREARYANYFQIGHNAFEFLLEFGQAHGGVSPMLHTRIISGPAYVKALSEMLVESIGRFEHTFGPIPEPDEAER